MDSDPILNEMVGYSTTSSGGGTMAMLIWLIIYLFYSYCLYLIAKKLGEKYAWMAWVPVLNIVLQFQMAKMPLWWIIGLIVPFLNIYLLIISLHRGISLRTGHGGWWTAGLIFLGWILYPVTAFTFKPEQNPSSVVNSPT